MKDKNKSILNTIWELPSKPIKGFKFQKGFLSRFQPENPEAFLQALKEKDLIKLNTLPVNIVEAYHGDMPKIYFKGGGTVKSLDVAISSTQAEDEALMHKLYQSTVESD